MRFLPLQRGVFLLASVGAMVFCGSVFADPPSRVARLAYLDGAVSFEPAGSQDWVQAEANRPLVTGDAVWADQNSRAELNLGRSAFALDSSTSLVVTNLDDRTAQMELAQGTLSVIVRRLSPTDVVEIDTPNLAFTVTRPGNYRIDVAPDGSNTSVLVRDGQANVSGQGNAYTISANEAYRFSGTDLSDSTNVGIPAPDPFDRFVSEREQRYEHASSARYVSPDMIGYADLDQNGTWQNVQGYGDVWTPTHVDADWAPYRAGHWAWVDPWGWTWVDDEPWGFAPFHYGRWARIGPRWGWIPGPVRAEPVYAPALVAFVGGAGLSLTIGMGGGGGGIGWFPLGPREIYHPSYPVSRTYINNVNTSNTTVNNTYVNNVYNNVSKVTYVNQAAPGAVTVVPKTVFSEGRPVQRAAVAVSPTMLSRARVVPVAAIAPTARALAPSPTARVKPPEQLRSRPVVARKAPPPAPVPFAAREHALAARPGEPLAPAAVAQLRTQTRLTQAPARHVVLAKQPAAGKAPPAPPATSTTRRGAPVPSTGPGARPLAGPAPEPKGATQPRPEVARPPQARPEAAPPAHPEVARPPQARPEAAPPAHPEVARPPQARPEAAPPAHPEVARPPQARPEAAPPAHPEVARPPQARPEAAPPAHPEVARPSQARPEAAPPAHPEVARPSQARPERVAPPTHPEVARPPQARPEAAAPPARPEVRRPPEAPARVERPVARPQEAPSAEQHTVQPTPPHAAPKAAPPRVAPKVSPPPESRPNPARPLTPEEKKKEEKKELPPSS